MNIKYHVQQFKEDNVSFCEVNSVIRISNNVFQNEFDSKRYSWAKIKLGNHIAYRQVIGSPYIQIGTVKDGVFKKEHNKEIFDSYIMMDYDLYKELNMDARNSRKYFNWHLKRSEFDDIYSVWQDDNLKIEKVRFPIKALWGHPDNGYRISIRISLLSFIIGIFSLIISFL